MRQPLRVFTVISLLTGLLCCSALAGGDENDKPIVKKGELTEKFTEIEFKMNAGTIYQIDLTSRAFDPILLVKNPAGKVVAANDDGGEGLNSRLMFVAPADGTYKLAATAYGGRGKGAFTVTVASKKAMFAAKGKLTKEDPMDKIRKESHHKAHSVKLEAGKAYLINLLSADFDTYLRVEDPAGENIKENDDVDRQNLNSRVVLLPKKSGKYNLVATSYKGGLTGKYVINVVALSRAELKAIDPFAALVGEQAPNLVGQFSFNGKTKSLADLKGKVVLVDFWAVWCGPCIRTFPHLREWQKELNDDGLEILGVTTYFKRFDFEKGKLARAKEPLSEKEENAMLQRFVKHHKLTHRIMAVSQNEWAKGAKAYGFTGIPTAVLIDRRGNVHTVRVGSGDANAQALEAEIRRLLKEKG